MNTPIETHLARETTTVCHCWRLTRKDGTVLGFTDHDQNLMFDGTNFSPQTGLTTTEARSAHGLGIDSVDVEGALSSLAISEANIVDGLYDGATVETFLVNWQAPAEHMLLRTGTIAEIRRRDGAFVATLEGPGRALDIVRGRYVRRGCDAELGDERCRVDADGFRRFGTVTQLSGANTFLAENLSDVSSSWFENGILTWITGARAGVSDRVKAHARIAGVAQLAVWHEGGSPIATGDEFSVVAGCDKSFQACKEKFLNQLNFRGFPHLPGNDSAYAYISEGGAYDGAPLVP